jgi:hypothetical protein
MAKSKKDRLTITNASISEQLLKESKSHSYSPFIQIEVTNKKPQLKIWFENTIHTEALPGPDKVHIMKGSRSKYHIVSPLWHFPRSLQEELARCFAIFLYDKKRSSGGISKLYASILGFCHFLSESNHIDSLNDINSKLMANFSKVSKPLFVTNTRAILKFHPQINIEQIGATNHTRKVKRASTEDSFEDAFQDKTYSDSVMMQILGFSIYRINLIHERYQALLNADPQSLVDSNLLIGEDETKDYSRPLDGSPLSNIVSLFASNPEKGLEALYLNSLLVIKARVLGKPLASDKKEQFFNQVHYKLYKYFLSFKNAWIEYLERIYEPSNFSLKKKRSGFYNYENLFRCYSPENEVALDLYILCQTGINLEVLKTLKNMYGQTHWKQRFDIDLGVDNKTVVKQQILRLSGYKNKIRVGVKKIDIRVPVNSYLYRVLEDYELIFNDCKTDVFFVGSDYSSAIRNFCSIYEILDDQGNRLTSIDSYKIRKVFAGAELAKSIDASKSGLDLTRHLRDALNHQNFDTTMFSYLMKTGVGNFAYSSAVVALTTKMLEDALEFKGKFDSKPKKSSERIPVYLCECDDPYNPSHDIPIATRCLLYDLCLGCERSTVYAEHIVRICYRVFQYENVPTIINDILADRKAIALDTLDKFRKVHPDGDIILERAYAEASDAIKNGKQLLPPILN